jgi:hypothetical protein
VKAKVFEVTLHQQPAGKSSTSALEDQINTFLAQQPEVKIVSTHINTVLVPAAPTAMRSSQDSSIAIFCTVFYSQ